MRRKPATESHQPTSETGITNSETGITQGESGPLCAEGEHPREREDHSAQRPLLVP